MAKTGLDTLKLRPKNQLYIALEELDFSWRGSEMDKVSGMWASGYPIADISEAVGRAQEEVLILLIDLAMRNKITARDGSIWGREYVPSERR